MVRGGRASGTAWKEGRDATVVVYAREEALQQKLHSKARVQLVKTI